MGPMNSYYCPFSSQELPLTAGLLWPPEVLVLGLGLEPELGLDLELEMLLEDLSFRLLEVGVVLEEGNHTESSDWPFAGW